ETFPLQPRLRGLPPRPPPSLPRTQGIPRMKTPHPLSNYTRCPQSVLAALSTCHLPLSTFLRPAHPFTCQHAIAPIRFTGITRNSLSMKIALLIPALAISALLARAADKVDFAKSIQPILEKRCVECHS